MYIAYLLIRSYMNPALGPPLPMEERLASNMEKLKEFLKGMVPLGVLIAGTLGTILGGLATPTEAASMGSLGALVLALAYRKPPREKFQKNQLSAHFKPPVWS